MSRYVLDEVFTDRPELCTFSSDLLGFFWFCLFLNAVCDLVCHFALDWRCFESVVFVLYVLC